MLSGMDYHLAAVQGHLAAASDYISLSSSRLIRWEASCLQNVSFNERRPEPTAIEQEHLTQIAHDAVAYINRLGQFYAFAKAKSQNQHLVRAAELLIFRNKHTAHRSIDDPRKEDDYMSMWSQAVSMGGFYYMISEDGPIFTIPDAQSNWQEFNILKDHPLLLSECMATLEAISAVP